VPDGVSVSANDTKLEANDGKYTTTINAATTIALTATTNGIEEIGVDNNAETIIYNLQGIRINSQIENLPAGFYIVNGKKIIIK
jgi:spore germination protein GerM